MHDADHGHGGQPPVPRHAEALHLQGPRLHHGLLDIIQAELGGAQTYTRAYQRGICTIYILIFSILEPSLYSKKIFSDDIFYIDTILD